MKLKQSSTLLLLIGITMNNAMCFAQSTLQQNENPMDIGISALFATGVASKGNSTIANLQGGGHDPSKIGFTLQNLELTLGGAVDPFFDAQTNIIMLLNDEGEAILEIEEAYLLTKQLPAGLQIKAGQFYTEFGRQNKLHPHSWAFVDQPIVLSRLLGADGLRSQGARVSWLGPLPWYSEVFFGIQNAKGATGNSFLSAGHGHDDHADEGAEEETIEYPINGPEDFLYSARWLNGLDLNDNISANFGVSGVWGPNANGVGTENDLRTAIYGADLYLKWQAEDSSRGYPFVSWHTEYLFRSYEEIHEEEEADHSGHTHAEDDHAEEIFDRKDYGWFSQISYGFKPGWIAGLRFELADSNEEDDHAINGDERFRAALNLTWLPTEFSKIRLQYNYDDAHHVGEAVHLLWLQFEYNLGSHAAHVF